MQNQSDSYFRLRPDVVTTVLQEGGVILDLRSKFFYSVNATALAIVQLFEHGATVTDVLIATQKWGANGDTSEVKQVLDLIFSEGLVEPASPIVGEVPEVVVAAWISPMLSKHNEPLQRIMVSAFDPGMPLAE